MNRLCLIIPFVYGLSVSDCNPAFLDCTTPPSTVTAEDMTQVRYGTIVGNPPPINWLDPIPIPSLPKIDVSDSLATINQQIEQAKETGQTGFTPTLPPLQGLPGVTITGNSQEILQRAALVMQLAALESAQKTSQFVATTPSPFVTLSIGFGNLPTFSPDLPIMQFKPNIAGWLSKVSEASTAVVELQSMVETKPGTG